jgi:uncharacterized protein
MRYLATPLRNDLQKKMVLLAGPRQCGKTTLAKSLLNSRGEYLNWDITKDRKIIREIAWPKDASLVVLDELHKAPKWKNLLKGIVDEFGNKPPLLVTGSARLDAFRRTGDALTGRHYFYRLHPIDPAESKLFLPELTLDARINRLLSAGGFPEAYLNPKEAARSFASAKSRPEASHQASEVRWHRFERVQFLAGFGVGVECGVVLDRILDERQ